MHKINWGVRLRNTTFWWTLVPLIVLLAQQLGFNWVPKDWETTFGTIMSILTVVGIINDPTTNGIADSEQALRYYEPKVDRHGKA
ncbi:TPA: phage holin [Streptococcus suis]|uniref:phage holin n=1 Tax=Streptococcus suis TaxID=1307 RepID=UPI0004281A7F|nr:phage holin [Streptococcus suis]HEM6342742.1 phage holin [Streptococcus suis]